jgi:glycosyltransferase involved in cell wall biosynthesis
VPALLAAADVLVCPSRHEPLGNVVIEAWAHAVPVVAAAAAGPAHLIDDGKTGLLVPKEDAAALAEAIDRAQGQCAADLVAAGHAAFEADYTEEAVVDRYLAFFDMVAG